MTVLNTDLAALPVVTLTLAHPDPRDDEMKLILRAVRTGKPVSLDADEVLFLRVLRAVLLGAIPHSAVQFVHVSETRDGDLLPHVADLDEQAHPNGIPPSFFSLTTDLARDVLSLRFGHPISAVKENP